MIYTPEIAKHAELLRQRGLEDSAEPAARFHDHLGPQRHADARRVARLRRRHVQPARAGADVFRLSPPRPAQRGRRDGVPSGGEAARHPGHRRPCYAETSHLLCKGFIEPMLELGLRPHFVILERDSRSVAKSFHQLDSIPERTHLGRIYMLSPTDPCLLETPCWEDFTDYQLCYWYALEMHRRARWYAALFDRIGIPYTRFDFISINNVAAVGKLIASCGLVPQEAPRSASPRSLGADEHQAGRQMGRGTPWRTDRSGPPAECRAGGPAGVQGQRDGRLPVASAHGAAEGRVTSSPPLPPGEGRGEGKTGSAVVADGTRRVPASKLGRKSRMTELAEDRKKYLQTKYSLHPHHFETIGALLRETSLQGRCVLEIGGSNMPREVITEDFQVDRWVSVNPVNEYHSWVRRSDGDRPEKVYPLAEAETRLFSDVYTSFSGAVEAIGDSFVGKFSVAISIAAFEHIGRLPTVLRKMYNALQLGGVLFSYFGPVYSSRVGHHCWVTPELNFNTPGKLPEFAHLLMKPPELLGLLVDHYPRHVAEDAVYQIYHSDRITRHMYEDYEQYMAASPFEQFECRPFSAYPVDPATQRRLEAMCPGYRRFDSYGMQIVARKLTNTRSLGGC